MLKPQNNNWGCAFVAMEYLTGIPREQVALEIGHDGSELIQPTEPEPYCYAACHSNEMEFWLYKRGYCPTHFISKEYFALHGGKSHQYEKRHYPTETQLRQMIAGNIAELSVVSHKFPHAIHAVAWISDRVFDPKDGLAKSIDEFTVVGTTLLHIDPKPRLQEIYGEIIPPAPLYVPKEKAA